MAGISGKGPNPSYCEGMSTGSVWRVSGEQSHLLLMTMITAIVCVQRAFYNMGWTRWEGESMLIFCLFVSVEITEVVAFHRVKSTCP